ncbi:MAG: ArsR/SmtB family transcription factor [Alphaproteobacteria bacterium]
MQQSDLDTTFLALAAPTRRAILARLATGEATVGELAEPFDISLPAISRHLKVLEDARLITREPRAQQRICRLVPENLLPAWDWMSQYRQFWQQSFSALDEYFEEEQDNAK